MRELQVGIGPGIGKDFATSIGPCMVTPDEIDPTAVRMQARVNGELWSDGTMGSMLFSWAQVIAHLSREQELQPGDVLGSGTVGKGCGHELGRWLAPGDEVELEVDGIGILRNVVSRRAGAEREGA
jgi:2-keto-4-pentenoate hydratase/2-oxohepta-3-ene-1,7-dioic acid hydratase in catechol pathway